MERVVTPTRAHRFADHLRSCGATFVAMMQAAHLWEHDNLACGGWLYAARLRTILVEREMRSGPVMILKIPRQHTAQVTLVEDDDVIQTFAADRANEALDIWILPG